jgi:hypothetical protein
LNLRPRTIRTWFDKICNFHLARVSNGPTESINNLIKRIKRVGFGFRNFENYRIRALPRRQTELASPRIDRGAMKLTPSESDDPNKDHLNRDLVGRPGLDPGTLGLKGHRVHYSLFIRFREPHIHRVLRSVRSVRSVAIGKC